MKITGTWEGWSFKNVETSALKVTQLKQWGVVGAKHIDFSGCENLQGKIPEPTQNSFAEV